MKPKTFNKKLVLNKKTVAHLNNREMGVVKGRGPGPLPNPTTIDGPTCYPLFSCVPGCTDSECMTQCGSDPCC
jgi:hypothetical protein